MRSKKAISPKGQSWNDYLAENHTSEEINQMQLRARFLGDLSDALEANEISEAEFDALSDLLADVLDMLLPRGKTLQLVNISQQ